MYNGKPNLIGANIKRLRNGKGISRAELALKLQLQGIEIERLTIWRIENGKRIVTDYEVRGFADALEVEINTLYE